MKTDAVLAPTWEVGCRASRHHRHQEVRCHIGWLAGSRAYVIQGGQDYGFWAHYHRLVPGVGQRESLGLGKYPTWQQARDACEDHCRAQGVVE
jgi:hypothetical protein